MSQEKIALSRIKQIALHVSDIGAATSFYRDTLGMKLLFEAPPSLAFFDCGGVRLMLSGGEATGENPREQQALVYYWVDDIKAASATLADAGATFIQQPQMIAKIATGEVWIAFVDDGVGNTIGLMSEVAG
ncbi:MAG TPA: VOC family protein [Gemmatimonadaceae bacterium]|nr:VOC family protein [Gemmatimonadaceae bacterium]